MAPKEVILGSFDPDQMSSGGGLASDFDGTVVDAQYGKFDYRGNAAPVVAVKIRIQPAEGHNLEESVLVNVDGVGTGLVEEIYKVADITQWAPTRDGKTPIDFDEEPDGEAHLLMSIGDQTKLAKNSKFGEFIGVALDAGMPRELAGTDLSKLVGLTGHWDRLESKSAKAAQGREKKSGKGGEERKYAVEILVLSKFEEMKSAKGKATATKSAGAATKKAAASNGDGDLDDRVVAAILGAIENGGIKKAVLGSKIIKEFDNSEMKAVLKLAADVEFLSDESRPWEFDAKTGLVSPLG